MSPIGVGRQSSSSKRALIGSPSLGDSATSRGSSRRTVAPTQPMPTGGPRNARRQPSRPPAPDRPRGCGPARRPARRHAGRPTPAAAPVPGVRAAGRRAQPADPRHLGPGRQRPAVRRREGRPGPGLRRRRAGRAPVPRHPPAGAHRRRGRPAQHRLPPAATRRSRTSGRRTRTRTATSGSRGSARRRRRRTGCRRSSYQRVLDVHAPGAVLQPLRRPAGVRPRRPALPVDRRRRRRRRPVQPRPEPAAPCRARSCGCRSSAPGRPAASAYCVPSTNPYAGKKPGRGEIWATGLRNAWRFSVDSTTGDLWVGDVGQNRFEEIDRIPSGIGGANLGWSCLEATATYEDSPVPQPARPTSSRSGATGATTAPRSWAASSTAATRFADELGGTYIGGDFGSGRVFTGTSTGLSTVGAAGRRDELRRGRRPRALGGHDRRRALRARDGRVTTCHDHRRPGRASSGCSR